MGLTKKEKRFIVSPHSFSSKQQKIWKYIIKKKLTQITKDFEFIAKHKDNVSQILGERMLVSDVHITELAGHEAMVYENSPNISGKDSDFL